MIPTYELSAAARLDLLRIWDYLAENASLETADRLIEQIHSELIKLVETPTLGHRREDLTGASVLFWRVQSYYIIYHTHRRPLTVARFTHTARDLPQLLKNLA